VTAPSKAKALLLATRPRTLAAGVVPVAVGSSVAFREHHYSMTTALVCLACALLIQIGTNLFNDYFDFKSGADTSERLGPARATAQGWLQSREVFAAATLSFALAFVSGLYLVSLTGWPLLGLGLICLAAGFAYTGGPFPLGYNGLGDLFVLVFFGCVAVCGTAYVQLQYVPVLALWASLPVGLLGVALLAVNNTRDEPTDKKVGKRTLVVRFGKPFGRAEWKVCVGLSFLIPLVVCGLGLTSMLVCITFLSWPLAVAPLRLVRASDGAELNLALAQTARLQLVFGLLFAFGIAHEI
jgi:1,4-dihydroxy-2-naphthoate polyprenyltransferase